MTLSRFLAIPLLALLTALAASASAFEIPAFTPNVVDPQGHLGEAEKQAVNAELQRIREQQHLWGAVLIVDTLGGEPIENVAVKTFEAWQLGQQGVDNGLLLVLAMHDRRSRFEVGYGLEGSITDLAARRALDAYLAPSMRDGDTAGAIMAAFGFLAEVVAQDPAAMDELALAGQSSEEAFDWQPGLIAWGVLLFAIWLGPPLSNAWVAYRRAALRRREPSLSFDRESVDSRVTPPWRIRPNRMLQAFLSINPGLFYFILPMFLPLVFPISVGITLLILALMVFLPARKYASPESYRRFLDKLARQRADLLQKGHLRETAPGVYAYTPAYHASQAASSSSSSSRSSGFSSSSGGGRSGGGGASSGW